MWPCRTEKKARVIPHPQHSVSNSCLNRQMLSPLKMLSVGSVYSIMGNASRTAVLLVVLNRVTLCIGEVAHNYHNEVDERPYSATATGYQLQDTCTYLSYIEAVCAKRTKKETKQECDQPLFVGIWGVVVIGIFLYPGTAFYANGSILVDFCSAVSTK